MKAKKLLAGSFIFLTFTLSLILAGCDSGASPDPGGSSPGSGGGTKTLTAPNITVAKLLTTKGGQYVMIAYDNVPEAAGYVLLISSSSSNGFIPYTDGKEYFILFSYFSTPTFNSAFEGSLSPASAATFRNASQGFIHLGTKNASGAVGNIAPGTYSYKVYAYAYAGNNLIRSDSAVYSVTID